MTNSYDRNMSEHKSTNKSDVQQVGVKVYICSCVKRDQLDVICFIISLFNAQHVSDVNTSIHPQELATYLLSYFIGCIALVRCVLVLRSGLAVVVWYPYAG